MLVRDWLRRVLPHLGRRQAEADLQEELRLHVELERERLRDTGVPDDEAARAARRRLGNATLIRERTRDVWGWRRLDDLGRDVRHALRGLRRNAAFTATVVCVLAAGIGANSAMFGIVHGMLIRPLPYPEPGAVVEVGERYPGPSSSRAFLTNRTLPRLPRSVMVPTSDATLVEDIQEIVFARARKAVREIRTRAAETGAADLTQADIEREIEAARQARRQRARRG